jgi:hypothetical protein
MMVNVIWKFPLKIAETQDIEMPFGSAILDIQYQEALHGDVLTMWALVNPGAHKVKRNILLYGTGQPIEIFLDSFIATVQDPNGFVWHLFDGGEERHRVA